MFVLCVFVNDVIFCNYILPFDSNFTVLFYKNKLFIELTEEGSHMV